MATKKESTKVTEEQINEDDGTSAASSIAAKPSEAGVSNLTLANDLLSALAGMPKDEAHNWLKSSLAMMNSQNFAKDIPGNEQNVSSVSMKGSPLDVALPNLGKAMKEDVAKLFGSEEISEEFKEKTSLLFETAVNARVLAEMSALEEVYEERLNEQVDVITESLSEQIDQYLSYVAKEWAKENEVAIESSLKSEIAEDFITGLRNLFAEHYVTFPEDKVDVVESLASEVESLKEKLNEEIKHNIELTSIIESNTKDKIFGDMCEGLAMTQVQKFKTLVESVDYDNPDNYKKKLEIVKENYFKQTTQEKPTSFVTEEYEPEDTTSSAPKYFEPQIASYAKAISRTIKK